MPHYPGFYVEGIKCEYVSDQSTAYYYYGSSGGEWAKVWARKSDNAIRVEYYYEYRPGNYTSAQSDGYSPVITGVSTNIFVYPAKGTTIGFIIFVSVARRVTVKGDGGSVSPSYTSSLKQASNISSTASGDFVGWFSGDGDNLTAAECTTPVTTANALSVWFNALTDKTYVARFNGVLSVGMNTAAGGIIRVYLNGNVQLSGVNATVTAGTLVRVVMYAAYNYTQTGWDAVGATPTGSDYSFYMPHADVTLTAILTQRASVTLTLDAVNGNLGEYWLRWAAGSHYFGSTRPTSGTAYSPVESVGAPITVTFAGASGSSASALKHVELWARKEIGAWYDTGLRYTGSTGSFSYLPTSDGRYDFRLVAEDMSGVRSDAAAGSGDCSTLFWRYAGENVLVADSVTSVSSYASGAVRYDGRYCVDGLVSYIPNIDGHYYYAWRTSAGGVQSAVFRLGSALSDHSVSSCTLYNGTAGVHLFIKDFKLQYSTSDAADDANVSDWADILSGTLAATVGPQTFSFTPVTAKRIRLVILNGHESGEYVLDEIEIRGYPLSGTAPASPLKCLVSAPCPSVIHNGEQAVFALKFLRPVSPTGTAGVDLADFYLIKTGTANGTLYDLEGSGDTYTVKVNNITGAGSIGIVYLVGRCLDAADATVSNRQSNVASFTVSDGAAASEGASVAVYQGIDYTLTATVHDPIANEFDGWFSGGGLLSADAQYSFTPGASDMTVTAAFSERDAYTIQLQPGVGAYGSYDPANAAAAAGCEITLRTPDIAIPSQKWLEGEITVNAVPADGWTLLRWNVTDLDTGSGTFYNPSSVGGTPTNPLTFTLNFNAIIAATFGKATHTITVAPDALSEAASATCYAKNAANEEAASVEANAGENVKCYATANEGYGFGGWYADGVLVSEDSPYEFEVEGPVSLTARYTAEVELAVAHAASADSTGTVSIDGGTAGATATANVLLGDTCVIKAVSTALVESPASGSRFDSWYVTDTPLGDPLMYLEEQTLTVTGPVSLTANFIGFSDVTPRYLALLSRDTDGNYDPTLGILTAAFASGEGEEITHEDWEAFTGIATAPGGGTWTGYMFYRFQGTRSVSLSAISNSLFAFSAWECQHLIPIDADSETPGIQAPAAGQPQFTVSEAASDTWATTHAAIPTNRHYVMTAVWGAPKPVLVRMMYASGSGISMGTLSMSPVTSERAVIQNGVSDKYAQGSDVVFSASPAGGCRFDGWYRDAACVNLESSSVSYTLRVVAPATLYAKFSQHSGSIYRWDSGTSAKMMLWRSKRYVAARPLSLSAARIYADAYPATLSVFTASSPEGPSDTDPAIRVSASRQDGFRLPMVRPEKYLELQVETNADVTDVAVATSMGGLNE